MDKDPSFLCEFPGLAVSNMKGVLPGYHSHPELLFMGYIIKQFSREVRGRSLCFIMNLTPYLLRCNSAKCRTLQWFYDTVEASTLRVFWRRPWGDMEQLRLQGISRKAHCVGSIINLPSFRTTRQNAKVMEQWVSSSWSKRWREDATCRMTKRWFQESSSKVAGDMFKLNREDFGRVVQVLTGHDWFARHRSRLGEISSAGTCRLCEAAEEEAAHLFWDCPALEQERCTFMESSTEEEPWTVKCVLSFLQTHRVQGLLGQETV